MRALRTFVLGMFAGAALLYALLWRFHGLAPPDLQPRPQPAAGSRAAAPVYEGAAGVPPAVSQPGRTAGAVAALPTTRPSREPGDSTDAWLTYDPLAPRPEAAVSLAAPNDLARLQRKALAFPVAGFERRQLRDNFAEMRGSRVHEALDILAPRGTPVLAVEEGTVKKLFTSHAGGLTVYEFDPGEDFCYYYAHLDRYAEGLREGQLLRKGETIGYVGTSGNAPANVPHLHFTVFKLGPEKHWWEGVPINPFPLWAMK